MNTTQRSQHQPATNLLQVVVNVNKKGEKSKCHCLLLGVKSFVVMFNKFESLCEPLKRKKKKRNLAAVPTSIPMNVGLMYKLASVE